MQETIQYYTNSGGPVYLLLLDASKAFDRIQFHFYKPFVTSNGVKQGEVLSPVLFTLYIDKLLNRLRQSKLGCYV